MIEVTQKCHDWNVDEKTTSGKVNDESTIHCAGRVAEEVCAALREQGRKPVIVSVKMEIFVSELVEAAPTETPA